MGGQRRGERGEGEGRRHVWAQEGRGRGGEGDRGEEHRGDQQRGINTHKRAHEREERGAGDWRVWRLRKGNKQREHRGREEGDWGEADAARATVEQLERAGEGAGTMGWIGGEKTGKQGGG